MKNITLPPNSQQSADLHHSGASTQHKALKTKKSIMSLKKIGHQVNTTMSEVKSSFNCMQEMDTPRKTEISTADLSKITVQLKNAAIKKMARELNIELNDHYLHDAANSLLQELMHTSAISNKEDRVRKVAEDSLLSAHFFINDIYSSVERLARQHALPFSAGHVLPSYKLASIKIAIMKELTDTFSELESHPELHKLTVIQVLNALQRNGIRITPNTPEELEGLRAERAQVSLHFSGRHSSSLSGIEYKETDVFIVGAGPGGLWAAISALDKDYKVTLVEKRESFDRQGVVALNLQMGTKLLKIAQALALNNPSLKINNKSIDNIITALSKTKQVKTKDIQALMLAHAKHNPNLTILSGVEINSIDGNSQSALFHSKEKKLIFQTFNYIIHADGANSTSHQILVKDTHSLGFKEQNDVKHNKETFESANYKFQGGMYMLNAGAADVFPPGSPKSHKIRTKLESPEKTKNVIESLKKFGWHEPRIPAVYCLADHDDHGVWVAGERPEKIKNNADLEKWFQAVMKIDKPELKLIEKKSSVDKDTLNWLLHELTLQKKLAESDSSHKSSFDPFIQDIDTLKKQIRKKNVDKIRSDECLNKVIATLRKLHQSCEQDTAQKANQIMYNQQLKKFERKLRKNKMNGAIFENVLQTMSQSQSAKRFGLNGLSFAVGDAVINPNFHFSHGTSDAMSDAEEAINAITTAKKSSDIESQDYFNEKMDRRIQKVSHYYTFT